MWSFIYLKISHVVCTNAVTAVRCRIRWYKRQKAVICQDNGDKNEIIRHAIQTTSEISVLINNLWRVHSKEIKKLCLNSRAYTVYTVRPKDSALQYESIANLSDCSRYGTVIRLGQESAMSSPQRRRRWRYSIIELVVFSNGLSASKNHEAAISYTHSLR